MAGRPVFGHVDDVIEWALKSCIRDGHVVSPRGMPTRELLGSAFTLSNPLGRKTSWSNRRWSVALAVGELAWHFRGSTDVNELKFYAPSWAQYTDDGARVLGSCYGHKIFVGNKDSQWEIAKEILRADPYTRRAVISTDALTIRDIDTKDKSCLNSIQFLIRDRKLDVFVNMRSNDVYLGLPYDVFIFSMFHERMARELSLELGSYHHFAASMHVYESDLRKIEKRGGIGSRSSEFMEPMPLGGWANRFSMSEIAVRTGDNQMDSELPKYWRDLLQCIPSE